ncbi:MAG: hypothetical protein DMG13_15470 [Acidobacteria bacterium]|nr:MAG: hypothetical protein DMG13_15470 [Acidobacteriota bacterium]
MAALSVQCPKCQTPLLENAINSFGLAPCPGCQNLLQLEIFPALFRQNAPAQAGEGLLVEGESTCFYHSGKKAVLPCQGCGRFLCALCDCELNGEHFCPACLETGRTKGKIKSLENRRTLYDSIALSLAVVPLVIFFFWFFTIVTAPMALFVAIRYWNAPRSIIHRTRIRYVVAMIVATLEVAGWGIGIYFLIENLNG